MTDITPYQHSTPTQVSSDSHLLDLWLHGRSDGTQRQYRLAATTLLAVIRKELREITLSDLQNYLDSLANLADATRESRISIFKSLFSFAQDLGYVQFNVAKPLQAPKLKNTLAERIMTEEEMHRIIALETDTRNHALLKFLYACGGRVSEVCELRWRDLQPRFNEYGDLEGGQVTLYSKGGKTRVILLNAAMWNELQTLRLDLDPATPVFRSRKGGQPLTRVQVLRIVKEAGKRAGLARVSPHWFRHAHASHALDRGTPISLLKETLGHSSISTTGRYLHAKPDGSSALHLSP